MKGIIGKKLGMTQIYDENGNLVPVTVIEAGPCPVVAVKTVERDGYVAQQLGFGGAKVKNTTKPELGHLKAAGLDAAPPAVLREVRLDVVPEGQGVGSVLKADLFAKGEFVDVSGRTKGKGFQGVVRRFRFGGGRASHGGGWVRRPGSIGMCVDPGKVRKGQPMPGNMGDVQRTVQNLVVVDVRPDDDVLLVRGSIPGANGSTVMVRSAVKK
ncbi:MAG: 50S ribosomal protein L3 [Lentisphaeria bacterium]|jgi:large subunit ribosomal protein L3|nr:50S ribosomal protein L3 [Lentisphaeria bacterium]